MTYAAINISAKPADENHPYGHGKIESIAALIETGLLFAVAAYVALEAIGRLRTGAHDLTPSLLAYAVLVGSIVVDVVRSRSLFQIARDHKSEALAADALHFSSDLVSSGLVLLGLLAAQAGYPQGDSLAAIGVAVFISIAGYRLGRRTVDTLMDAVPAGLSQQLREISGDVGGVTSVQSVRVRTVGHEMFAEIALGVARTLSLERVTAIKTAVEAAVTREFPEAHVTLATTPVTLDDETILERVLHVAAVMRRPVHHVTIQHIGERLAVSLDLEVDGRMSVKDAHAIASELEHAIEDELGPGVEVETHIEPLDVQAMRGHDVGGEVAARIEAALAGQADQTGSVKNVHDVRVRQTEAGLVVNYHCNVAPGLSVADMHNDVDAIERAVRRDIPEIVRVVGHAEPAAIPR
jgi:cation diffusion facilitator family transporter